MSASPGWPNYQGFITQCWGYPAYDNPSYIWAAGASNVVIGTNPPYSITDFFQAFPNYAGPTVTVTNASFTASSAVVAGINTAGLSVGQYVSDGSNNIYIPSGTTISAINAIGTGTNGEITLSQPALLTGVTSFLVYAGPSLIPIFALNGYIALASASLVQARWLATWPLAMALYIAHFATLFLRSEGNCSSTCGQAAVAGLKQGITVSASADGVSQSLQVTPGLEDWGSWNETSYGVQLATFAKSFGAGPMMLY